jgi:acetylornithine deacetylase/succinyl-diaminopimelate desuccinylase-like protein
MPLAEVSRLIEAKWSEDLVPRLVDYVRVPARSPAFDPSWAAHGELDAVVASARDWAAAQPIAGLVVEIVSIPGRTPCLYFEAPATGGREGGRTVLFYGHLDKQPEMTGWREGFGAYQPVIEQGRLYGRGGADDGYAVYAALAIIQALDAQGIPRPRCVGLIETSEESGSPDLPAYLEQLAPRFGDVALVAGLDSGCGNYDQLWVTTSLRGLAGGALTVEVLTEGVHSGNASGIVPSSFRVARRLLDRIDDSATGRLLPSIFHAPIPEERQAQAVRAGAILGDTVWRQFPWAGCVHGPGGSEAAQVMPTTTDPVEGILNRTWRGALSVTGAEHLPGLGSAGNVLRPRTTLKLSVRLPPTVDAAAASAELKRILEADPPYQARVRFEPEAPANGWNAPATAPWLQAAVEAASRTAFGREAAWMGEGGTIPFMAMLGERFPQAQFLITGVLGPGSNAHGPNEFLDIGYAKRLSVAIASVVAACG